MREEHVCLDLLLSWLAERHDRRFAVEHTDEPGADVLAATATDASFRLAIEVHPIVGPPDSPPWLAYRDQTQDEIAKDLAGAFALWLPPGADLPTESNEADDFVRRVREVALSLSPGQRSHVSLPTAIDLRKVGNEGGVVSVTGALNRYWARLTERVRGSFDLDSTRLHRLPESEEHLGQLFDLIWERAAGIEAMGRWVTLDTVDAWTLQRLSEGEGVAIVGRPPQSLGDVSLAVRRNLRRILADAAPRLRGRDADVRAVVLIGFYAHMEEEGATTAMRGYDPALYSALDFVCLAADGVVKALMEAPSLPWGRDP